MRTSNIRIHNCHTHIFTLDHLPRNLFPFFSLIAWLVRIDFTRKFIVILFEKVLSGALKMAPRKGTRVRAFLQICSNRNQDEVFRNSLRHYYPADTRFIILPMDYSFMDCGDPKFSIDEQLEELAEVKAAFPEQIIPFVHIDPRHEDAPERIKHWVTQKGFMGVKIYPPFGYSPADGRLDPIFSFCEKHQSGIPVMTHCSGATLKRKGLTKKQANAYCSPEHCRIVLDSFPDLRLCLGHFGGDGAWEAYLTKPLRKDRRENENWLETIIDMIKSEAYPNLYVDISYVIFHYQDNSNILKVLLESPPIRRSVLFGTDYYMAEIEKFSEKKLSMYLRAQIGEDNYRQIAEINPQRYLFGD